MLVPSTNGAGSRTIDYRPQVNRRINERQPESLGEGREQGGYRYPPSHHPKILAGARQPSGEDDEKLLSLNYSGRVVGNNGGNAKTDEAEYQHLGEGVLW